MCCSVISDFCKCDSDEFDERGGDNQNKEKKCCKDCVEIKCRCRFGYCCTACWYCLLPRWGRNLSLLKAFTRALRISLYSRVLQDTHLRGKLLKPPLSFIELLLLWGKKYTLGKTQLLNVVLLERACLLQRGILNVFIPKSNSKSYSTGCKKQETDLQIWVTTRARSGSEGTFSSCGQPCEGLGWGVRQELSAVAPASCAAVAGISAGRLRRTGHKVNYRLDMAV